MRLEDADAVASGLLGGVQRPVCKLDQDLGRVDVLGHRRFERGDTEACGHLNRVAVVCGAVQLNVPAR